MAARTRTATRCRARRTRLFVFFSVTPAAGVADGHLTPRGFLRLTPLAAGTDGFFVAVLTKAH